jgi:two-component system, response regulator YesN
MHLRERWLLFMYKMLLVDDESRQLKVLANIVRALRPEYEVYEALNGRLALDFIQDNPWMSLLRIFECLKWTAYS